MELTRAVGEWDERWRFRRVMDIGARERFALAELSELATARPCVEGPVTGSALVEADLPELPDVLIDEKQWKSLLSFPLFSADAIHLKEARATLVAVKHGSRDSRCHSQRYLLISDSMCCVLSVFQRSVCESTATQVLSEDCSRGFSKQHLVRLSLDCE